MRAFITVFLLVLLLPNVMGEITSGAAVDVSLFSQIPDPVQPGNYVEVRVKVENTGAETLEDFEVELVPEYPFTLIDPAKKKYGAFGGGNRDAKAIVAKWKLQVNKNALEGEGDIRVRYRWKGSDWITSDDLTLNVKTADAILNIKNITTEPASLQPGDPFELNILLENQADSFLKNLNVKLDIPDEFVTVGSTDEKSIRLLDGGEEVVVSYNLISQGSADKTIYEFPMEIEFFDNQGNEDSKNATFGVVLLEEPQLIKNIDSSEILTSGNKGKVTISLSNIGVEEVKFVTLKIEDTEDYRVVSSKEIYMGNIDSDDFETANYELFVNTDKKSVPLDLILLYKDSLNNEYQEDLSLQLPLYSSREASSLGLTPKANPVVSYIGFVLFIFIFIFWLEMFVHLLRKKMVRYKKIIWGVVLVTTTVFGALVYYFLVKRNDA